MDPLQRLDAVACALPAANIDTDQIIPARFMKQPRQAGYGGFLLHDLRFDEQGWPRPDFPLNRCRAQILVTRANFGAGSSREAAVYALLDYGIRCVLAPSFGDIFAANAVNNGLLPACISPADTEMLIAYLNAPNKLHVDLETRTVAADGRSVSFDIDPGWRTKLLNGWDDRDLTRSHAAGIAEFCRRDVIDRPWLVPSTVPGEA